MRRVGFALCTGLWLVWLAEVAVADVFRVADIEILGLQRIAPGTVFTYLPVDVGDEFDTADTAQAIRAVFKTGFFEDVALYRNGNVLVLEVVERPAIAEVNIDGNRDIPKEALEEALQQIGLVKGRVFDRMVLDRMQRELQQQYFARGKYNLKIDTEIQPLVRNRVKIAIDIEEGPVARIRQVSIVGNHAFTDETLLALMESGLPGPLALFSQRDRYAKQKLAGDLERIRSYYLDRGYLKFDITSTQVSITPDKRSMHITINIEEGERYRVSDVQLAGEFVAPEAELRALVDVQPGDWFSRSAITEATEAITTRLGDDGFAFANVNPVPDIDDANLTVRLTLFVDPGQRVYVRRINFFGNEQTRDVTLRRELRQMEAGWYATSKIERSKIRIQRLSFIENVDVETQRVPGSDDQVDLNFTVTERQSGELMAGIGFSQAQGIMLNGSVTQRNFRGEGKELSVSVNRSTVTTLYSIAYTNPYFTVDGISRGLRLFYRETDADELGISSYSVDRFGAGLSFGVPLSEYDRFRPSLDYSYIHIDTGTDTATEVLEFLEDNGNGYNVLSLDFALVHDTRDRTVFATRGNRQQLGFEFALPGLDLQYYKALYQFEQLFPVQGRLSVSLRSELAYGNRYGNTSDLPFFEKYFAGGINSVRGYEDNSLGPLDSTGDPFGGNLRTEGSIALVIPPPFAPESESVRMSLFYDFGNVFAGAGDFSIDALRTSLGVGMTWLSPIGALTFSLAKALNDRDEDELQTFQFSVGATF